MATPMDMMQRRPYTLSPHAAKRATELGYRLAEVIDCATNPDLKYETDAKKYGPNEWLCKKGDIACVVRPASREIVTVLLPGESQWRHGQDRRAS